MCPLGWRDTRRTHRTESRIVNPLTLRTGGDYSLLGSPDREVIQAARGCESHPEPDEPRLSKHSQRLPVLRSESVEPIGYLLNAHVGPCQASPFRRYPLVPEPRLVDTGLHIDNLIVLLVGPLPEFAAD